jgi:hypothetical protein
VAVKIPGLWVVTPSSAALPQHYMELQPKDLNLYVSSVAHLFLVNLTSVSFHLLFCMGVELGFSH